MFADKSWYETYELTIQNTDNIGFNNDIRQIALRMKTGGGGSNAAEIFNDVTLPDIHINVIESLTVWKGKQCHSHADPHMRTFDGYAYECHHTGCSTGITSILFENKEQYQQVQVRHHKCYHFNARCICGIAVRSGKDVFMFDSCNGRQYINFPICDDKSLKVIKVTDKSYKIFFPTGTYVTTTLNMGEDWFLQTEIYPSVADVGKTGGLCGLLDGTYRNDLTRRTGIVDNPDDFNYHNPPDEFSISWRARSGEDLFSHSMDFDTLESLKATLMKFCSCDKGVTDCSYQKFKDCEGITKGKEYQCLLHSSNKRRRRHAVFMKSFPPDPVENNLQIRFKRQADYTTENATMICNKAFEESHTYRICRDSVVDFPNDSVQNCILDVSLTGETSLVDIHIESAMDQCKAFIGLNETLRIEQPDITKEIESICQNNCSYHGSCNNGSCFCDEGFEGSDCSFDITEPVNINEVLGGTLCDKSTETCNVITLFGQYFVEKMNFTCYIKVNDISIQGQIESTATYETRLEEQTLYEANCPNPHKIISNWVNELSFNISNDGKKFSRTFGIFIYKSECQIPRNESGAFIFTLATGYCFIDGKCVRNSQTQMNNRCRICDIEKDNMHWSYNEDCISSTVSTVDNMSNDAISGETTNLPSTLNAETSSIVELTQSKPVSSSITTSAIFIPFTSTSPESSEPTSNLSSPSSPIIQTTESSNNANILSNKEALNLTHTTIVLIVILFNHRIFCT